MEAPEKIQIHLIKNDYDAWSVQGYSFLTDKQMGMTEYTRTDAFIEKAVWWLSRHFYDEEYQIKDDEGTWICADDMIEDFKNYMKGE